MKDEMKDIDQLFREKLGASSGKYQADYWTKMEALLAGNGASALWRNVRNAGDAAMVAARSTGDATGSSVAGSPGGRTVTGTVVAGSVVAATVGVGGAEVGG